MTRASYRKIFYYNSDFKEEVDLFLKVIKLDRRFGDKKELKSNRGKPRKGVEKGRFSAAIRTFIRGYNDAYRKRIIKDGETSQNTREEENTSSNQATDQTQNTE